MNLRVAAEDGVTLAYTTRGRPGQPALLFLNSIGCDRELWNLQVDALSDRFFCITFDARGHGASDATDGDYSIAQLSRDALAVLDALGLDRVHVCGLSLGGVVGQWLAVHAPDRVERLVLANTASRIGSVESWETRRRAVLAEGLASIADVAMQRFFSADFRDRRPDIVGRFRAALAAGSPRGYAGCCAALRDADLTREVMLIAAPTLVIGGDADVSTPPEAAKALAAEIQRARLEMLPAAHLSNVERPAAFTAVLRAHLEDLL